MKFKLKEVIPIDKFVGQVYEGYRNTRDTQVGDVNYTMYSDCVVINEVVELDPPKKVKPGIYSARKESYNVVLRERDILLEPDVVGVGKVDIANKIGTFFEKHEFFSARGLLPKRGLLLHGPAGCGKTHEINKCVKNLVGENGLAIFVSMDEVHIAAFVGLLESLSFEEGIDKIFIVIEDLGGGEMTDQKKGFVMPSQSHLLALLDGNSLPWKKIPTVMLSTTNYPKNFLENILDRPGRFDDVIEFSLPDGEVALQYAKSLDIPLTDFDTREIQKGGVSLAHVKEALVRKAVYDEPVHNTLDYMRNRSEQVKKDLEKKVDPFS